MPARILILITCAIGLAGPAAVRAESDAAGAVRFERHQVILDAAERQTVLTGFLLGGERADLAVLRIDGNGDRRLRIHAFDAGAWSARLEAPLARDVQFVDVARVGGRDRLITGAAGRLDWFDPESATERALLDVTVHFDPPRRDEIPHVDVTRDLNGDGRDDLAVPVSDGFRVFVQTGDGSFADPVTIGRSPKFDRIYGADGYRYDPWSVSRIHEIDYDRDGQGDLVYWSGERFVVHRQDERGQFAGGDRTFPAGVAFDSDDLSSLATGEMTGRVLHSLADMNGDGIADLVVFSLRGRKDSRKSSRYEVHFGVPTPDGGTRFAPEVGAAFQSDGSIQLGMERRDFDRDGQADLMFTTIEVYNLTSSLWKRWKGFWGDDIWLKLEFYRMEGGPYPDHPTAIRRRQLDGSPSSSEPGWVPLDLVLRGATHVSRKTQKDWPRAFNTTLLIGDVTGDGRADLIIEHTFRDLYLYAGVPGPDLFARKPQAVTVTVPNDEEYTWLVDLNRDGKQDILLHDPFIHRTVHGAPKRQPGSEAQRVTLLVAR